jgi:hypothetical protein
VAELVKIHHGSLNITSSTAEESDHHGSTFTVRIPLGRSHLPPDRIRDEVEPVDISQMALKNARGVVQEMGMWTSMQDSGSSSTRTSGSARSGSVTSTSESDPSRIDPNTLFWTEKCAFLRLFVFASFLLLFRSARS